MAKEKKVSAVRSVRQNYGQKVRVPKSVPGVPMFQRVFGKMERGGALRKRGVNFEIGTEHRNSPTCEKK